MKVTEQSILTIDSMKVFQLKGIEKTERDKETLKSIYFLLQNQVLYEGNEKVIVVKTDPEVRRIFKYTVMTIPL